MYALMNQTAAEALHEVVIMYTQYEGGLYDLFRFSEQTSSLSIHLADSPNRCANCGTNETVWSNKWHEPIPDNSSRMQCQTNGNVLHLIHRRALHTLVEQNKIFILTSIRKTHWIRKASWAYPLCHLVEFWCPSNITFFATLGNNQIIC